jgi:hypothetical protein
MEGNGKAHKDERLRLEETPPSPPEAEPLAESADTAERPSARLRAGPDVILDERLNSAAAPFLYLLAIVLISIAGYFVYAFARS